MQEISITENDSAQRIDRFLRKYFPSAPLTGIYKFLRTGKIKLNGKRVDNEHRIDTGDILSLYLSDEEIAEYKKSSVLKKPEEIKSSSKIDFASWIIYEDDWLLAINKPYGINVHPGDHKTKEVSIIQLAQDYFQGKYDSSTFSPSLVHRIDRDTTGVLLIAKDRLSLNFLLQELQAHKMEKTYLALVTGSLEGEDTIDVPLLRIENAKNESKVRVDSGWQRAITHYKSVAHTQETSLLKLLLETGRMHQIRVHLTSVWHPIIWDASYGNRSVNRNFAERQGVHRQLLHASELTFLHPKTKKNISIKAPLPEDMQKVIRAYFPLLVALDAL